MNFVETTLETKSIFKGKIIDVNLHTVELPNGKKVPVEELLGKSAPDGTTLGFELKSWKWSK